MSGGIAVADVNGDGWPDIYATSIDGPDALYLNQRDGTFVESALRLGLSDNLQTNGAAFGDIDNDGDQDLFVTVIGAAGDLRNSFNRLYVNYGSEGFREEALARSASIVSGSGRSAFGASFGDYDRDGWIDLTVARWLPNGEERSTVLRNQGILAPGHFDDVSVAIGAFETGSRGFAPAFVDLDADGFQDLTVVGDFGTSNLFWNADGRAFEKGTLRSGVGTDENGMGSTFGDFDGDGDLDWFISSIWDPRRSCDDGACNWGYSGNRLFRNNGDRTFSDVTDEVGVREGDWGWGASFFDFDNDGWLDLAQTNGVYFSTPEASHFYNDRTRLWRNTGSGQMHEIADKVGLSDLGSGKGLITFDYDKDGDLDLLIAQNCGTPLLLENTGGDWNSWLRVRVVGIASCADGLGAVLRLWTSPSARVQVRQIGVGSHFLGQGERVAHFGLGQTQSVHRLEVFFPASGVTRRLRDVAANQELILSE